MAVNGEDYGRQLGQLLPPGLAWTTDPASQLQRLLRAFGEVLARAHRRADDLDREIDPSTTHEILDRWEAALGLPDKCSGALETTLQGRRNALVAKLFATGGQSVAFFLGVGLSLGFDVTISEFRPFRAGRSAAGDPLTNGDWVYAWRVNAPETTVISFRAGRSAAGESLQSWGNDVLECKLNQLKPAQTILLTGYGAAEAEGIYQSADQLFFAANYTLPSNLESV
ncbi:Bacteriophage tail protein [Pseudomonas sp. 8Z]|uniref:YmfQ family protein n=1 Tax=Pseudomonas sp. 8Z TaxID=2653166 RepID=UPI0012F20D9B|nr:putative phage tail protein [Pseudomonas sp. 8Z]VXC68371.1 Bacteriophage tail protein [Pseudomonas sp. 8Z]